jgi:hypothetical protein
MAESVNVFCSMNWDFTEARRTANGADNLFAGTLPKLARKDFNRVVSETFTDVMPSLSY